MPPNTLFETVSSQEELRELMGRLSGRPVDPTPHTDFGQNIHIGRNVFINAGCYFQDHGGGVIGDGAVATREVKPNTIVDRVPARLSHRIETAETASNK